MNFRNPTSLQIGQSGTYRGKTWQVTGRVVLGVVEDGEIYYWHEFNLENQAGENATLVFEKTEQGPEWRWFTQFEPEYPMTAEDAATKQVGDPLNLDGTDVKVTLRETSRIYFVEGTVPEGEVVDAEASYFNAEHGNEMLVVSWTGNIVECYRGRTISGSEVRQAFRLGHSPDLSGVPAGRLNPYDYLSERRSPARDGLPKVLIFLLAAVLVVLIFITLFPSHHNRYTAVQRLRAAASPLRVGAAGVLTGMDYHITGHVLMSVAEVNVQFERHEYFLRDKMGGTSLLVSGLTPGQNDWVLFTPFNPSRPLTPIQAGAVKLGQIVSLGSVVAPVDALFLATVRDADFDGEREMATGDTFYGFEGLRNSQYLLVWWNAGGINFLEGHSVSSRSVLAALGPGPSH
jgi:hypothetical protein